MWWRGCYSSLFVLLCLSGAPVMAQEHSFVTAACDAAAADLLPNDPAGARGRIEAQEAPLSPACQLAVAETYLLEGNDFWALRSLQGAQQALGEDVDGAIGRRLAWLLCVALVRTEQWEDASLHCDAQPNDEPAMEAMLRYYGGIAAFRSGDDLSAVVRLERPTWPVTFDASARRFLGLAIGRMAGVRPGLELSLGSLVGYDSNALMTPEDAAEVGVLGDVQALKSAHWLQLGYRFKNVGRYVISLRGNGYRSFHYAELPAAVNATDLGGSATVQRYGVIGANKMAWEARYGYRVTFLDGGEATLEDDLFGFVEAHSVSLGPSFWTSRGHGISVRYAASYQRFAERVRNGFAHNLSLGEELRLAENLTLAFAQAGSFAQTEQAYQRWGVSLGTFLAYQPLAFWTLTLRGTGVYEDYFNSRGYFDSQARQDWIYSTRLESDWSIGAGFTLGVFGGASGRHSTVDTLTYDKWEGGLQVRWSYGGNS